MNGNSCGCAGGNGGQYMAMAADMISAMNSLNGPPIGNNFVSYPSSDCGAAACASACYKSQSQRYLELLRGWQFQGLAVAANADPLAPIFAAITEPGGLNPVGAGVGPQIFNNQVNVDKAALNNLYVFGLAVTCCLTVIPTAAPNPTGGAGTQSVILPSREVADAICCQLLNTLNVGIYPTADTREAWLQQTPLAYFARVSPGDFKTIPAVKFCDQDASFQVTGQVNQYQVNGNALPAWPNFLPYDARIFGSLNIHLLTTTDPRRCGEWAGSLFGCNVFRDPSRDEIVTVSPGGQITTGTGTVPAGPSGYGYTKG